MIKMVRFKNGWFDCDEEKTDYVMKYIDHLTKTEGYSISELSEHINDKFELDNTELALIYYIMGVWAGENSNNLKSNKSYDMAKH